MRLPFTFDTYQSEEDGTWVVHIDTTEDIDGGPDEPGPRLRVYINDGEAIYENPPFISRRNGETTNHR